MNITNQPNRWLLILLALSTVVWGARLPQPRPKTAKSAAQTQGPRVAFSPSTPPAGTMAPAAPHWGFYLEPYYLYNRFANIAMNGAGVRLGKNLFGPLAIEGTFETSDRAGLTFASIGATQNRQFTHGALNYLNGTALAQAHAQWMGWEMLAELGPGFTTVSYQGFPQQTFFSAYYGVGLASPPLAGVRLRVDAGERFYYDHGPTHLFELAIGPQFSF